MSETEQIRATVFLDEKARLERRLQELERERERLRIQLDFLEHVLARAGLGDAGTAGRLGPTAAITQMNELFGGSAQHVSKTSGQPG